MNNGQSLDPWIEGYLGYLRDVKKLKLYTLRDVRCTLKRVAEFMARRHPGMPMWKCSLQDYLVWLNESRDAGYSAAGLAKDLSHVGVISMLMGHRSPAETGVYLHALPGRKEQAVARLSVKEVWP